MAVLRVQPRAQAVTMPWRNGGGVTHELWKHGDGAAGFGVRLSIAEVAVDGPFSRFDGVDRVILMLAGNGFSLTGPAGAVTLDAPGVPFAFRGEQDWMCTLIAGPVRDFNVMVDRAAWSAQAWRAAGRVEATHLLALEAGRVDDHAVVAEDLVFVVGEVTTTMPVIAMRITPVTPG